MEVTALDHKNNTYQPYPEIHFPNINYIVADIAELDKKITWDLVICSHIIEHMEDPLPFIQELQRRSRYWVLIYCPFNEIPLVDGHKVSITRGFVDDLKPIMVEILDSPAWHGLSGDGKCILFVVKGNSSQL